MAGLLDDILGYMESPQRTQQMQGLGSSIRAGLLNIEEKDKKFQNLYDKAFGDPKNPAKVTNKAALSELTEMAMAGPMAFAPIAVPNPSSSAFLRSDLASGSTFITLALPIIIAANLGSSIASTKSC